MHSNSRLVIAGAGPGDPELISVKALKEIMNADVILYDALVNKELLNHAQNSCILINVGKRAGDHKLDQMEINSRCVEYAKKFRNVLRLKGGDPFIFGRGFEELDYAHQCNVKVEVIPGISSATALTGLLNIPLTCRGINHGFTVVTATNSHGEITEELIHAAGSGLTTVILMGLKQLQKISALYSSFGKGKIPSIIISNGSLQNEDFIVSPISDLFDKTQSKKIDTPAIIVVGEVVGISNIYKMSTQNEYIVSDIPKAM